VANLASERILITGASGFLGSHLSRRLLTYGAEIHAVSRTCRESQLKGIRWWQADLTDAVTTRSLFQQIKPGAIFHLSGLATARSERELILPTFNSLLVSTVNVLMAAADIGCRRVVLAASLTEPQPERFEITPGSPYAAAKWASGAYARMFHRLYDLPVVMVRPFMTYGPAQDEHKLIPYVILSLLQDRVPELSSGRQEIDWVYIDDVIEGFLAAASESDIEGCTIDLGSGVLIPIRRVVRQIVELVGTQLEPLFGALPDRPTEPLRVANMDDAYAKLSWKPQTPLSTGLARTIAWYREQLQSATPVAKRILTN
jgi:nucleoside-diphosphate-sugar epimerase